ncbi:MAG: hypothetical protein GF416_04125 [Candidatus Altiarchaeales archaeon]|nr:hypothetical protein [Candidatus Altiarchaeales archaeon]MBD3416307.1 hypothetical protein [Candidatus Altiarchaeales archaeon]
MAKEEDLEREAIDHFRRRYLHRVSDTAHEDIYWHVVEHKYGARVRDPHLTIDWVKVFEENQCPACRDTLVLKGENYICGKCGFTLPLELYDRAAGEHAKGKELKAEGEGIWAKMIDAGYDERRIRMLFKTAAEKAREDLMTQHGKREADNEKE